MMNDNGHSWHSIKILRCVRRLDRIFAAMAAMLEA